MSATDFAGGVPLNVTLLGTGCPPPNPRRRGPATLFARGGTRILVDAGSGVAARLVEAGVRVVDLERVFLTHLHSDHVIDLGHLVLSRWIIGQNRSLEVFAPAGARVHVERLLALWEWDIEVRWSHMHEREPPRVVVTEIEDGRVFSAGGLTVTAFAVEHEPVKPAFGFVTPAARTCGWPTREAKVRDLASYHTGPDEVGKVAARAGVGTLVLTHLMPGSDPADLAARAARDFAGKIVVGEDLLDV